MNSVLAGLSKLDIFGQMVFLRINRQANYKTTLGGCASVAVMGVMVLIFITNFISFIHKEQLKVISIQEYEGEVDVIPFDEGNFIFAIQVEQDDFISNPYFNINIVVSQFLRTANGSLIKTSAEITLIPCTIERFTNIFDDYDINFTQQFQQLKLYDFLCPLINTHAVLGGTYSSTDFQFVDLSVVPCQNNSIGQWSPRCLTPNDSSFKVRLLTVNQIVNPYKPKDSYIQPFLDDSLSFSFNQNQTKSASVLFTKYKFSNDESLLPISMIEEETFFVIDSSDVKQDITELTNNSFVTLQLKKKPFVTKFQRQYQKLDELLSNIGGILQIVSFFVGILMIIYNRINCNQYNQIDMIELSNKIYEFSMNESDQHKIYQNNLQILKTKTFVESKSSLPRIQTDNDQSQDAVIKMDFKCGIDYFSNQLTKMFEQKKPINLDIQIFLNYISCNKFFREVPRVKLMNKACDQIIQQSDIFTILSRLNEIEKLKEVLLTPKQLVMFNFTPKPLITLEDEELKIDRNMVEQQTKTPNKYSKKNYKNIRAAELLLYTKMMIKQKRKKKQEKESKDSKDSKDQIKKINQDNNLTFRTSRLRVNDVPRCKKRSSFLPQPFNNFMYQQIYNAYEEVFSKNDTDTLSKHLIQMLGPELETIYKVCKILDQEGRPSFTAKLIKPTSTAAKGHWKILSQAPPNKSLIEEDLEQQDDA